MNKKEMIKFDDGYTASTAGILIYNINVPYSCVPSPNMESVVSLGIVPR